MLFYDKVTKLVKDFGQHSGRMFDSLLHVQGFESSCHGWLQERGDGKDLSR